jgi:hypothetical protein
MKVMKGWCSIVKSEKAVAAVDLVAVARDREGN